MALVCEGYQDLVHSLMQDYIPMHVCAAGVSSRSLVPVLGFQDMNADIHCHHVLRGNDYMFVFLFPRSDNEIQV